MPMLESGQILKTVSGVRIKVESFIAEGGQGEVYRVDYNGEKKALKWYKPEALRDPILFYDNLKTNAAKGSCVPRDITNSARYSARESAISSPSGRLPRRASALCRRSVFSTTTATAIRI